MQGSQQLFSNQIFRYKCEVVILHLDGRNHESAFGQYEDQFLGRIKISQYFWKLVPSRFRNKGQNRQICQMVVCHKLKVLD